jgi:hypothetical protein
MEVINGMSRPLTATRLSEAFEMHRRPRSRPSVSHVPRPKTKPNPPKISPEELLAMYRKPRSISQDRCRPVMKSLEIVCYDPATKEKSRTDLAYLQEWPDKLSALRELLRAKFGSSSEILRKLDMNGRGILSLPELEAALASSHVPWQQITGLTRNELFRLLDRDNSGSVELSDLLGTMYRTPRAEWVTLPLSEQWKDYCHKIIEIDFENLIYSKPLWEYQTNEEEADAHRREEQVKHRLSMSKKRAIELLRSGGVDISTITKYLLDGGEAATDDRMGFVSDQIRHDDLDDIQSTVRRIENHLKDFSDQRRDLFAVRHHLAQVTEAEERRMADQRKKDAEEAEALRLKQEKGKALVAGGKGLFNRTDEVLIVDRHFRPPTEDELVDFFNINNVTDEEERVFRSLCKTVGINIIVGEKIRSLFAGRKTVDEEQFYRILHQLKNVPDGIDMTLRFRPHWISAKKNKLEISQSEFLHWYHAHTISTE